MREEAAWFAWAWHAASPEGSHRMAETRFTPTTYHRTFGPHAPVAHVRPGDTIVTTTLCAAGRDANDEQVGPRGNPLTGPFFVEGARPGDAVSIRIDRLVPNRPRGWSRAALAPVAVDPDYVTALGLGEGTHSDLPPLTWQVDTVEGAARLLDPVEGLEGFVARIAPMLGCIGVAPSGGQAISTATSGPHGGNMDYRLACEGTTIVFPVSEPGALVFVGDAHALQGAGELVGTGIEISCDVTVTVDLVEGADLWHPRGETATDLFTIGNARPLDLAAQLATTEMDRMLRSRFGLSAAASATLIGQCADFDLGNMFDPAFTMVCKMPKAALEGWATDRSR